MADMSRNALCQPDPELNNVDIAVQPCTQETPSPVSGMGSRPLDSDNYREVPLEAPDPGMHIREGCLMAEIPELSKQREEEDRGTPEGTAKTPANWDINVSTGWRAANRERDMVGKAGQVPGSLGSWSRHWDFSLTEVGSHKRITGNGGLDQIPKGVQPHGK